MLHDAPLYFCWLGVLLERVGQTARILDVNYHAFLSAQSPGHGAHPIVEVALWLSLLRACYGFEPFMKSHRGTVSAQAVASFLIFERRFPRGVRHGLQRVRDLLEALRPSAPGAPVSKAFARIEALERSLEDSRASPLDAAAVHEILTRVVDETSAVCDLVQSEVIAAAPAAPAAQTQSQSQAEASDPASQRQSQSQSFSSRGA
jgi:uncharacterized alpha-E superfamily protein